MVQQRIDLKFDGACDNNSKYKYMGVGVAVFLNSEYSEEHSTARMGGLYGTNNIAEWKGMQDALKIATKLLVEYPDAHVRIYGDSQLIIKQFNLEWKVKNDTLRQYFSDCRKRYQKIKENIKVVEWFPREDNVEADILSKKGITDYWKKNNIL